MATTEVSIAIVPVLVIVPPDKPVPAVIEVTVPPPDELTCCNTNAVVANCVVLVFNAAVGAIGDPVNTGLTLKTLLPDPVLVVTPVPPFNTFNTPLKVTAPAVAELGEKPVVPALNELTRPVPDEIAFCTNAVVANCVVLVPAAAVGAAGAPKNVGVVCNTTTPEPVVLELDAAVVLPYASTVTVASV